MDKTVKIKLKSGAEALVYEESLPAWESVGAEVVKTAGEVKAPEGGTAQPNPGVLEASRETEEKPSEAKKN